MAAVFDIPTGNRSGSSPTPRPGFHCSPFSRPPGFTCCPAGLKPTAFSPVPSAPCCAHLLWMDHPAPKLPELWSGPPHPNTWAHCRASLPPLSLTANLSSLCKPPRPRVHWSNPEESAAAVPSPPTGWFASHVSLSGLRKDPAPTCSFLTPLASSSSPLSLLRTLRLSHT